MQLVLALLLHVAPPAPPADLETVLRGMFARATRDAERQVSGARWLKTRTDTDITDPAHKTVEHQERYRVWGGDGYMFQQKVWRDGRSVSEKFQLLPLFIDGAFLKRFEYILKSSAPVPCGNRTCWQLGFSPKPGTVPQGGGLEQVLMGVSSGTLLVECKRFGIVGADAHMPQPYTSFKVDVYWFSMTVTQVEVDGVMVTETIDMRYEYNPLIGSRKTEHRLYEYTDITLPPSQ